ncbi:MAG TPA: flagellar basal-body MS-ring/collar protein FliF [Candidatus Acidoferrales bacterium]|jgi:flagellar M-ring protein FliF|nr:flagellar basal-body MS-ring/collar protein FliF [Candidatus Acidoferrales bacterium]
MNQNLSKLLNQLRGIWSQLGASQRVSVAAATFVLVAGLTALSLWSSRADYGLLYGGLSDSEAAKVIAALDDSKVSYKTGNGSIYVPADKIYTLRMQLAGRGIPSGDGVGFEIFDKPNFGISDFVQHANYVRAVEGELARTISQIDEVEAARVMIVLPENRLLLDKDTYPTASVFVHVRGNSQLDQQSINSIRFLVANSVEGLKPNHVAVVDNLGNVLAENTDDDSLTGLTDTQLGARRNLEQYLAKKGQDMLEKVLGPGQAIVRVSADINYDTQTQTQEKFDPDGQVVRTETKNDEQNDSTTSQSSSGPVGITSNISTNTTTTTAANSPVNNMQNHKTTSTTEYEIGKTTSSTIQAAGGIKRLTASVTVAQQMQGEGADRKPVARTPEELTQLSKLVSSAVGIDTSRGDTISLEELPFNEEFATDVTKELNQQQQHDFWINIGRNAIYPAMGVVALLVLLQIFKRTPVQEIPIGVPVGRLVAKQNGNGNGNGNGHGRYGEEFEPQPGVVTVDVLNRLIKENPTNMTQAIRDWMNKGPTAEN